MTEAKTRICLYPEGEYLSGREGEERVLCLVTQSCPTLCDPIDCSPSGSSVHGILHARMLEWVAMPSSRGSYRPRDQIQVSCIAGTSFTVWATKEAQQRVKAKKKPFLLFQDRRPFRISDDTILHVWPSKCPLDGKKTLGVSCKDFQHYTTFSII